MIPSLEQSQALWEKYHLPENKRRHVTLVAQVAQSLAKRLEQKLGPDRVNLQLLVAGALLHDIDKAVDRLPGEQHPDAAVRVLTEEGMEEVAALVKTHPLHAISDPALSPKTWEEKLLYLADKMVKYDIITVDERFALWRSENLPQPAVDLLDQAYPLVKQLETEVCGLLRTSPHEIGQLAQGESVGVY